MLPASRLLASMSLVCLLVQATSGSVIYSNDFEGGADSRIVTILGSWEITSPGLNGSSHALSATQDIHNAETNAFRLDGIPSDWVQVDMDFVMRPFSQGPNGDFGIFLNTPLSGGPFSAGYGVTVNPPSGDNPEAWVRRLDNGSLLATHPNNVAIGQIHHLRVDRAGNAIDVYLDQQLFMQATDDGFHGGAILVVFYGLGAVDNLVVTAVPEPTALWLLAVGAWYFTSLHRRARRS